jgi:hypothetical protein
MNIEREYPGLLHKQAVMASVGDVMRRGSKLARGMTYLLLGGAGFGAGMAWGLRRSGRDYAADQTAQQNQLAMLGRQRGALQL